MLSKQQLEYFRRIGPAGRYRLSLEMAEFGRRSLDEGGPEAARRRWEAIRRQHEEGCRRPAEGLARFS